MCQGGFVRTNFVGVGCYFVLSLHRTRQGSFGIDFVHATLNSAKEGSAATSSEFGGVGAM